MAEMALLTAHDRPDDQAALEAVAAGPDDGPVRMIATDYYGPDRGRRAGAHPRLCQLRRGPDRRAGQPFSQIGKGYFAILIDQGEGTVPYQGITPLAGGSLSACAETYFAQSEQLPTRFALSLWPLDRTGRARALARRRRDAAAHAQGLALCHRRRDRAKRACLAAQDIVSTATMARTGTASNIAARHGGGARTDRPGGSPDGPSGAPVPRGGAARLRRAAGALRLHLFGGPGAAVAVDLFGQGHRADDDGRRAS